MRPRDVSYLLESVIKNPQAPAIYLWGPPGIGKSSVCRQVAERLEIGFVDMRLALMDPTDLRGIPVPDGNTARWLAPSALPQDKESSGLLLLDELNLAPHLVQSSAYQLVLDRCIGEYELPAGWRIVAGGNRREHGARTYDMAAPLRNRFVHINFEQNLDDWMEWAIANKVADDVVAFIAFKNELLFKFDANQHEDAFPTPRSWEFVSRMLMQDDNPMPPELMQEVMRGTVGEGASIEFFAFLQLKEELPHVEEILEGNNYKPNRIDMACALAVSLASRVETEKHFERMLEYSDECLPTEAAVFLMRLLVRKNRETLAACPSFPEWAEKHYDIIGERQP